MALNLFHKQSKTTHSLQWNCLLKNKLCPDSYLFVHSVSLANPKTVVRWSWHFQREIEKKKRWITVEPPVGDHPKSQDFSGQLRKVVRESNQRGTSPGTSLTWLLILREFIAYVIPVPIRAVLDCRLKFLVNSEWRSAYTGHGDQTKCPVVAYKRLTTMKNYNTASSKSGRWRLWEGRLQEVKIVRLWRGKYWCFG